MCDDTRYFRVEGKVYADREDVIDWLNEDRPEDELDYDYQPTDEDGEPTLWCSSKTTRSDGARATSFLSTDNSQLIGRRPSLPV